MAEYAQCLDLLSQPCRNNKDLFLVQLWSDSPMSVGGHRDMTLDFFFSFVRELSKLDDGGCRVKVVSFGRHKAYVHFFGVSRVNSRHRNVSLARSLSLSLFISLSLSFFSEFAPSHSYLPHGPEPMKQYMRGRKR